MSTGHSAFSLEHSAPDTLAVSGALDFDTAEAVLSQAGERLQDKRIRVLDLAGVNSADSAGLACVLALMAESRDRDQQLELSAVPKGLALLSRVSGTDALLGIAKPDPSDT
ncbi:STAS domain-containing protein [Oleiagrimonas sp.]|jgi:phospholipid transport system transporter-binding protein|uniref:STAS domain-containing protein n=1 Tax=Oleiagrimonas sp. TaxID=2010330 RepID=UPI0026311D1D|nr:STAS domain-containing protein [Oleiagrimonas sp.]MDA3913931.1 STAS domain-containing protein [Oleiagrimonas sp.]